MGSNDEVSLEWLYEDILFMTTSVLPEYVMSTNHGTEKKYTV